MFPHRQRRITAQQGARAVLRPVACPHERRSFFASDHLPPAALFRAASIPFFSIQAFVARTNALGCIYARTT
jgi:hypothetical protein